MGLDIRQFTFRLARGLDISRAQIARDFWDMETQIGIMDSDEQIAMACSFFMSVPLEERTKEYRKILFLIQEFAKNDPVASTALDLGLVLGISGTDLRPEESCALEALCSQLGQQTSAPFLEVVQAFEGAFGSRATIHRLFEILVKEQKLSDAELLAKTASFDRDTRSLIDARLNFCKGRLDAAVEITNELGDKYWHGLYGSLLQQDYRPLLHIGSPTSNPLRRAELWLLNVISPTPRNSSKSIRSPSTISIANLDPDSKSLIAATKVLETIRQGSSADLLISSNFSQDVARCMLPEHRVMLWRVAANITSMTRVQRVENWAQKSFAASCKAISGGLTDDVLRLSSADHRAQSVAGFSNSRFHRGIKFSKSALKLGVNIASARMQSALQRGRSNDSLKSLTINAIRDFFNDISQLRGGIQKIAQLGISVEASMPYELRDQLRTILEQGPSITDKELLTQLEEAFGPNPLQRFSSFTLQPYASGSVGQIHRAITKDGEVVSVKVKYPNIEKAFMADFRNLQVFSHLIRSLLPQQDLKSIVSVWEQKSLKECDFEAEVRNQHMCESVLRLFDVETPRLHEQLCTHNVIVSEFIDGMDLSDFAFDSPQEDRNRIAVILWKSLYGLLSEGMFRSDIHPGNYKVRNGRLVYLDFGAIQSGEDIAGFNHFEFMRAISSGDLQELRRLLLANGWSTDENALTAAEISMDLIGKPFRGKFQFTEQYATDVFKGMTGRLSGIMTIPIGHIDVIRIFWSLYSILAMLRAQADWRQVLNLDHSYSVEKFLCRKI